MNFDQQENKHFDVVFREMLEKYWYAFEISVGGAFFLWVKFLGRDERDCVVMIVNIDEMH